MQSHSVLPTTSGSTTATVDQSPIFDRHYIVNSLPNYVVDVQSIDVFKVRLDKFWAQQEVMFDWTADLTGTGDRSEYTVD